MSNTNSFDQISTTIPGHVKLVAVSKTKPISAIQEIYKKGHRIFGENKVQELLDKYPLLPDDIEWHFIGHLQRNKVKFLVPFVHLIHGVDSERLLKEINKQAEKIDKKVNCLLQFHIAEEDTKFGLDLGEAKAIFESEEFIKMKNVTICGVMGMGTFIDNESITRKEFQNLKNIFDTLKEKYFVDNPEFREISMGMSGDYTIAIEEGSTLVRIGSAIFGSRY
jgi:pyridoxal phosphate enzyme (YggS family)